MADSTDRARHGWSEYGNSRHFERTWVAATVQLRSVDTDLALAAPAVWRAVWLEAVLHRAISTLFLVPTLVISSSVGMLISWWFGAGLLLGAVLSRAFAQPYFRLDRPTSPISFIFQRPLVKRAVNRNAPLMSASALTSRHLSLALDDPLADLSPAVLQTAKALAPGFVGTIGELKEVAALVTIHHDQA